METACSRSRAVMPLLLVAFFSSLPTVAGAQVTSRGAEPTHLEVAGAGGLISVTPRSLFGGEPVAELVVDSESGVLDLQPGPVKYTEIVAEVVPAEVTALLRGWLDGTRPRVDGHFVVADATGRPQMQRGFTDALITELAVPALDARRLEPIYFKLRMTPAQTHLESPKGGVSGPSKTQPAAAFSLQLDGLDQRWVSRIEPFSIGIKAGSRVTVTLAPAGAAQLTPWHDGFVLRPSGGPLQERSMTLRLLRSDGTAAFTLVGQGVGILALRRAPPSDMGPVFQADLYVERWELP